jgi:hypothetical protein
MKVIVLSNHLKAQLREMRQTRSDDNGIETVDPSWHEDPWQSY